MKQRNYVAPASSGIRRRERVDVAMDGPWGTTAKEELYGSGGGFSWRIHDLDVAAIDNEFGDAASAYFRVYVGDR